MRTITELRQAEFEKYRKVYRDYPNYTNKEVRIGLTREWVKRHAFGVSDPSLYPDTIHLVDVGCGRGEVVAMARDLGLIVWGCEVLTELCQHDGIYIVAGAHALPWPDKHFDLVTCTDVMEHIIEDDVPAVLRELKRVAVGPVLLTICHRPDTPGKFGPDTLHITVHDRAWWEDKIRQHMSTTFSALYTDRVNENGTWFEVLCG